MSLEYTIQIWKEKNQFVAHAMPLDVMSSGPTPDLARYALAEVVDLFLATAAEVGTLTEMTKTLPKPAIIPIGQPAMRSSSIVKNSMIHL